MSSAIRPPRTRVILFYPRFAGPIRAGTKTQTVRYAAQAARGDLLSLRVWRGKPYRSPQEEIVPPVRCSRVTPVRLQVPDHGRALAVFLGGDLLDPDEVESFARADGFGSAGELAAFHAARGLVALDGVLIQWESI